MKIPERTSVRRLFLACILFVIVGSVAHAQEWVLIKSVAPLDEPRGLCLDIPGHRDRVNVKAAMVVHTCKWGLWNHDERFDRVAITRGELRMPAYDLCVGATGTEDGARLALFSCNGHPDRIWRWSEGRFRLEGAPEMCLTIGPEPSQLTRGGRRLPSRHVARSLALHPCREADRDRQVWELAAPGP